MSRPDLNLLVTLDVLLAEGSVARAAKAAAAQPVCHEIAGLVSVLRVDPRS